MHLFVTEFFREVWIAVITIPSMCIADANKLDNVSYYDSLTGRFLYGGLESRGGAIAQFLGIVFVGPWIVVLLADVFLISPIATRLGYADLSLQTSGLLLLAGFIGIGMAWYVIRVLFLLARALFSGLPRHSTLYEVLTPDGFSLFFVSRMPGLWVALCVLAGLFVVALWVVLKLLMLMF